jgi:LuxR family transcriptional regulator, maltose regulon positive regulatory protein
MSPALRDISRLTPPPPPPGLVHRPRLDARLTTAAALPLTLIAAGPGSGKTVLLTDWTTRTSTSVAWVSLEAHDDEPNRLWTLVGYALLAAGIVGQTDGFGALPHSRTDTAPFLGALLRLLPGPSEYALVLDDAHHLTHPTILAELDAVVRNCFPRLRLYLSSRSDPFLPLHRYRLAGQMYEIRAADLAMTRSEAHALLSAHGVRLASRDVGLLTQRTEGWAAGLRLSAMSMAQSRHPAQFVTQLALDQGSVGEYLMEEVLERQSQDVRRLLVQTSFLDDMTGSLAAAVTGIESAPTLLAELSRTNSFVVPVDHDGDRYRYHHLLGEILHHLLRRDYPRQLGELRSRASAWYQEHDNLAAAMRYAAKAADWPRVCVLLARGGFARAIVERLSLVDLGLGPLADMNLADTGNDERSTSELIARAAVAVVSNDSEAAAIELTALEDLSPDEQVTVKLVDLIAAERAGSVSRMDRTVELLLDVLTGPAAPHPTPGLRSAIRIRQARAHYWAEDGDAEVEALLMDALRDARECGLPNLELEALGFLELTQTKAGRVAHARETRGQSQLLIRDFPHLHRMAAHHLAGAHGKFMRADAAGAERALRLARASDAVDNDLCMRSLGALLNAWVLINAGAAGDAHQLLLGDADLRRRLPKRLARYKDIMLADIETRLGRPNAALKAMSLDPAEARNPKYAMVSARASLELGDAAAAAQALRPVLIATQDQASLPNLVIALLLSARTAQLAGDDVKAVSEIVRAADLAAEEILQPFVEAEPFLEGVLSRHAEARQVWPRAVKVTVPTQTPRALNTGAPPLAQMLTERETAVLRRLATTMTTSEIADELCVSINTVKTHIAAIYRKLPSAGRRDAVARARQLELL